MDAGQVASRLAQGRYQYAAAHRGYQARGSQQDANYVGSLPNTVGFSLCQALSFAAAAKSIASMMAPQCLPEAPTILQRARTTSIDDGFDLGHGDRRQLKTPQLHSALLIELPRSPRCRTMMIPVARWYQNAAGYRQVGLYSDDLIPEESELVQTALSRLDERERYDRVFRIRRAIQCSIQHTELPRSEWTKEDDDKPYLRDVIRMVKAEMEEREALDTMKVNGKKGTL